MFRVIISLFLVVLMLTPSIPYSRSMDRVSDRALEAGLSRYEKTNSKSKFMIIVDFTLPSTAKRLCIVNTETRSVDFCTYSAHGVNSGGVYATSFSNVINSRQSSLGLYRMSSPYYGKHGLSINLDGLDKTNSNAFKRRVVMHEARYIGGGKTGRSWGCFAIPVGQIKSFLGLAKSHTLIYAYY